MSTATAPAPTTPSTTKRTLHCAVDDWDFDPRYTDGVCPICGWGPGPKPLSSFEVMVRRVPWDYVLLAFLAIVLVVIGVMVGRAANVNILPS